MKLSEILNIGDCSENGQVTIVDQDRLCYVVKNISRGSEGLRTISKELLEEFVRYFGQRPYATANDARDDLSGRSKLDRFEYGYASTLKVMAEMCLGRKGLAEANTAQPEKLQNLPLQQIFYGAPGTGKSNMTNLVTAKHPGSIRTTFHPDSDYSTFVGAYKPTMEMVDICDEKGQTMKIGEVTLRKEQITYKFVKQAFLKAYIQAWKLYQQTAVEEREVEPQFLVIEEINRGNCAQIFGDLFQLLDRKNGFSEYPIEADEDIRKCLLQKDTDEDPNFGENGLNLSPVQKEYIDSIFDPEDGTKRHVADKICKGEVLVLPPNLYIWATMNTSDQSLFPIDSAFKRRWDWKYMRITNHPKKAWNISFDYEENKETKTQDTDWWAFLQAINKHIKNATHSEDKQLGYFFCKAKDDKYITAETFVGKVIFYLWNDVFKTSGYKKTVFNNMDFDSFYIDGDYDEKTNPDGIDKLKVHEFIEHVLETAQEPK